MIRESQPERASKFNFKFEIRDRRLKVFQSEILNLKSNQGG
jgi:hypothetical protein